jgi:Na+-driven multidrug efflux pump
MVVEGQRTLSTQELLRLFVPLALSSLFMAAAETVANSGIARLPKPELSLAAFGVTLSIAILIEGPVIMLVQAANALVDNFKTYRLTYWFANALNLGLTVLHAVIAFTPLFDVVFRDIIGLTPTVAALARPAFIILIPWTPAIGWRRFLQGILINRGWTTPIAWGTAVRISSLTLTVVLGVLFFSTTGVIIGAAAMTIGVLGEAVFITSAFIIMVSREEEAWLEHGWAGIFSWNLRPPAASSSDGQLSLRELLNFYWPLALTSSITIFGRPLISAALARSHLPELSLATWPVVWSTTFLFCGPLVMLQQIVIGNSEPASQRRTTGKFTLGVALVVGALLLTFSLSPISHWYLTSIVGVSGAVLDLAVSGLRFAGLLPLFYAAKHWFYGLLIKQRKTLSVNAGAVINLVFLGGVVFTASALTDITGVYLVLGGLYTGLLAEATLLRSFSAGVLPAPGSSASFSQAE